jgi:hypothetical protein
MSGFGLKAFKKLKEEAVNTREKRIYYKHLVIADDFNGVLKFLNLQDIHGRDHVGLISENGFDKEDLVNEWRCSLNPLRDENFANLLIGTHPKLEIHPSKAPVLFYKDSKFHEFFGRVKHFEFKPIEEQFLKERYHFKWENLISDEKWNTLTENLSDKQYAKIIQKIELVEASDLVEPANFIIHTGDFEKFECENLYWNDEPKKLTKLVSHDSPIQLSDATMEYLRGVNSYPGISVAFRAHGEVYDDEATIFLPQSVTHSHGHFIGDFYRYNPETKTQDFTFSMILQEEDTMTEEELAKKIKLLKRVMERTIPNFSKIRYDEFIRFKSEMFFDGMNDELAPQIKNDHPNLYLVGNWAPVKNLEVTDARNWVRGIFS